jgi:hypothetical protein
MYNSINLNTLLKAVEDGFLARDILNFREDLNRATGRTSRAIDRAIHFSKIVSNVLLVTFNTRFIEKRILCDLGIKCVSYTELDQRLYGINYGKVIVDDSVYRMLNRKQFDVLTMLIRLSTV